MDTEELGQKLKGWFTKGAQASKEAFEKAGDKVQEFSDKSVVRLEKKQLEGKLDAKYKEIGEKIVQLLNAGNLSFTNPEDESGIKNSLEEIKKLQDDIKAKEALL